MLYRDFYPWEKTVSPHAKPYDNFHLHLRPPAANTSLAPRKKSNASLSI